jgi:hypothetical protein
MGNGFGQQSRIIRGTSRNQSKTGCFGRWKIGQGDGEFGTVLGLGFILPGLEVLSRRGVDAGTQKPWFDNVIQRSTGAPTSSGKMVVG